MDKIKMGRQIKTTKMGREREKTKTDGWTDGWRRPEWVDR